MGKQRCFFWLLVFCLGFCVAFVTGELTCSQEKKIVIVIPSYNNKDWYERNLDSVLGQDYMNYRIIYTDDVSTDGTGELVAAYKQKYDVQNKITLVRNKKRQGALYNLYRMIHTCDGDAIIVTLDGDDWFPDDQVLKRLNTIYSADEVWLTYGQFQMYPHGTMGWATAMPEEIVKNNAFRDFVHLPSHLRTFYAWLFKKIKLEDFLYNGRFFMMAWDMTMMFPMIEMAGERHRFIPEVMYIYNDANNISDHRISRQLQAHLAQVMRDRKPYQRLVGRPTEKINHAKQADIIIFSDDSARQLARLLKEIKKQVTNVGQINVLYRASIEHEIKDYNTLQNQYETIQFFVIDYHRTNFRSLLSQVYKNIKNDYIFFMEDKNKIIRRINLEQCITVLEQTHAYGFYFSLCRQRDVTSFSPNLPLVGLGNDIYAWDFSMANHKWSCANTLNMALYRKDGKFLEFLRGECEPTPRGFEAIWANEGLLNRIGLCYGIKRVEKKQENKQLMQQSGL